MRINGSWSRESLRKHGHKFSYHPINLLNKIWILCINAKPHIHEFSTVSVSAATAARIQGKPYFFIYILTMRWNGSYCHNLCYSMQIYANCLSIQSAQISNELWMCMGNLTNNFLDFAIPKYKIWEYINFIV